MGCANPKDPPKGAFTAREYAEYAGIALTTAQWRLERLVRAGRLKAGLFLTGSGRKKFYWLASLVLGAVLGHAQTQIDINRQTRGTLQLGRGGTGQTVWVAGKCVQVSADGTKLESAPEACGGGGGGGSGDITAVGSCTGGDCFVNVPANRVLASPSGSAGPVTDRALVVADIPNLPASKITSGTFADARIAQSNVTQHQGALQLDASQIVSGILPIARGGTGKSSWTPNRCVQVDANGNLDVAPWPCSDLSGSGTSGRVALWTGSTALGNSSITESSTEITTSKNINAPVWDKGGAVCNVKAYGAKGDGVTDDTQAIQGAINSCAESGTVYLPASVYKVTDALSITKSLRLTGSHGRYTILAPTTGTVLEVNTNDPVMISDIYIYAPTDLTSGSLIRISGPGAYGAVNPVIERVWLRGGWNQISFEKSIYAHVHKVRFVEWRNAAVYIYHTDPDSGHTSIDGCDFAWPTGQASYGVYVEDAIGTRVTNSFFLGVPRPFRWYRNTDVGSGFMNFSNNYVDGAKDYWMEFVGAGTGHAGAISIANNNFGADTLDADPNVAMIRLQGSFLGTTITGNTIVCAAGKNQTGILIDTNYGGITVTGNWIASCTRAVKEQIADSNSIMTVSGNSYQWIGGSPVESSGKAIVMDGWYSWSYLSTATFANGSQVYCYDCQRTDPCSGGGTGAFAKRINGAWVCN